VASRWSKPREKQAASTATRIPVSGGGECVMAVGGGTEELLGALNEVLRLQFVVLQLLLAAPLGDRRRGRGNDEGRGKLGINRKPLCGFAAPRGGGRGLVPRRKKRRMGLDAAEWGGRYHAECQRRGTNQNSTLPVRGTAKGANVGSSLR